jgi:hypothetical protein
MSHESEAAVCGSTGSRGTAPSWKEPREQDEQTALVAAKATRLTLREATMSCWCRNPFSTTSSARDRVRSATTPPATLEGRHASLSAFIARAARLAAVLFCGESQAIVRRRREVASPALHASLRRGGTQAALSIRDD